MSHICVIQGCEQDAKDEYCENHLQAKRNLDTNYDKWKTAFGSKFTVSKYYDELLENPDVPTGIWIKEIILHILDREDS